MFSLAEAINKINIPLIKLNDEIIAVSQQYQKLKTYSLKLNLLLSQIDDIFRKIIYTETTI